jgi:hypothetical protein
MLTYVVADLASVEDKALFFEHFTRFQSELGSSKRRTSQSNQLPQFHTQPTPAVYAPVADVKTLGEDVFSTSISSMQPCCLHLYR